MDKKADRGKLFLPFAALNGFEDLVRQQTQQSDPRRARSDEENEALSRRVLSLRKGMRVRVTYYALYTNPRMEKKAEQNLKEAGFEVMEVTSSDCWFAMLCRNPG